MTKTGVDSNPLVRITPLADDHLERVIEERKAIGLNVNKISLTSEAILSIPLIPKQFACQDTAKKPRRASKGVSAAAV